jgi:hypothetical protein
MSANHPSQACDTAACRHHRLVINFSNREAKARFEKAVLAALDAAGVAP